MIKAYLKERRKHAVLRQVLFDCAVSMWIPVLLTAVMEITDSIFGVVTADTLGGFADAVFSLDLKAGAENGIFLVLCVAVTVFVVPLLELIGNFSMLKRSLRHDNLVISHFLEKRPEAAKAFEEGKLQYQLEDEPLTMRIWWVRICSKALALPVCGAYLLYRAGSVDSLLTVMLFVLSGTRLAVPALFKNRLATYDRAEQAYHARRRSYEKDIITNCPGIRLSGIQKPMTERLRRLYEEYYQETDAGRIVSQVLAERSGDFAGRLSLLLLAAAGAVIVAEGHITPGGLAAMLVYFTVVQSLMGNVGEIIQNCPLMMNAAAVVGKFYQEQETVSGAAIEHIESINGEGIGITFLGKELFQGIDFSISEGEKIGICGRNGSGKSTFGKILASLIREYYGKITVGSTPYRGINVESWRHLISYVPQNSWLSFTTVRENIMMGNFEAGLRKAEQLMYDFGLSSIADKVLSADCGLSGGERQKVSVIRGLLKESELLILDEPTNHLDRDSVLVLKKYIRETKQSVILISHDEQLLDEMDRCIRF